MGKEVDGMDVSLAVEAGDVGEEVLGLVIIFRRYQPESLNGWLDRLSSV